MKCTLRALAVLLVAALLMSIVQPMLAQEEAERYGLRFDAPEYAIDGPYPVGVRYFTIPAETETDRELIASVWYPALNPTGEQVEIVYEQQFEPGQIPPFSTIGHAILDAEPDDNGAPYPLVVYTHAHWSMGQEVPYFVEHLTSQGYVVISVDHEDNWSTDFGPMAYQTLVRRPQEVTREIDFAEELSETRGELEGMITTEKVGIGGWSLGGVTAMMEAGARMDLENLRIWCEQDPSHSEVDPLACVDTLDAVKELAEFAGLEEVPEGLWPEQRDDRIAAAVRLSGGMSWQGEDGLSAVDIPVMLMHGGEEAVTDPSLQMGNPYESVSSAHKAEVVLKDAGHFTFFSSCDESPDVYNDSLAIGYPTFCADDVWDMDRAHDLINHFATAFFDAELKGDAEAAAMLAPEAVSFPGIQYQAEGYGSEQATLSPELVAEIEAFVQQEMDARQIPGTALGIVKDGELVYAQGFGVANVESGKPVTPETVFLMSSIAKSITGMAVMQLVQDGKIELDAPVTDYLPYFTLAEPKSQEITIRQLLDHTSGFAGFIDWDYELNQRGVLTDAGALDEYIRSLGGDPLAFEPGEAWEYSSVGFDVLGDVVAQVSGKSYEEYVQEHILSPLGMASSTFLLEDVDTSRLASPHVTGEDGGTVVNDYITYTRIHAPSDGLFSTVEDMARLAIANLNHGEIDGVNVLSAPAYEEMWAPQAASTWEEGFGPRFAHYGLGWWVGEDQGSPAIGNYGADTGYSAQIEILPDQNAAVVFFTDLMDFGAGPFHAGEIGGGVAQLLIAADAETSTAVPRLDPELVAQIDAYVEELMAETGLPGFALGIVKDGGLAYAQGYGLADVDTGEPVTPQTVFQVAEVTYAPTAMAVLKLASEGLLDLDAPITKYLPYFTMKGEGADRITARHLLDHTSGVPDSGDAAANWPMMQIETDEGAVERFVRSLADRELLFAPGEGYEWSDVGYDILGDIVAKVTGQPFEEYMQENILAPLGMANSTFLRDEADGALLASPHIDELGAAKVAEIAPYSRQFAAANNLHSNVEDMAKLMVACLNKGELEDTRILPAESFDAMWASLNETNLGDFMFGRLYPTSLFPVTGMGWSMTEIEGHPIVHAYGGERGFQSEMMLCPDMGIGIIAMGNREAGEAFYSPDTAVDVMGMLINQ